MEFKEEVIKILSKAVIEDEFSDEEQNKELYGGGVHLEDELVEFAKRNLKYGKILEIGCGSGRTFKLLPITHAIEPNPNRLKLATEIAKNEKVEVKQAFAEAILYPSSYFDTVIMWNTWCFLRSEDEATVEVNRVLKKGGRFIFNVLEYTRLPLIKTTNARCLVRRMELFGFELIELRELTPFYDERKVALCLEKVRNFDYRYLKLPQLVGGNIGNYLSERDWHLK